MNKIERVPYVRSLPLINQGKVRDLYKVPGHLKIMLMVATDAISTHNMVHESTIPLKGQILTAMSVFSSKNILGEVQDHIYASGKEIYKFLPPLTYPPDLHLRAILVQKAKVIPVEFIHRAYMAGSLYKALGRGPNPYGLDLPKEIAFMGKFNEPIFTPTEKSERDFPLDSRTVSFILPEAVKLSQTVFNLGRKHANKCGIELVDCKLEIGMSAVGILLIDEWLNSDCCRFVEKQNIHEGVEPEWLDKQIVRDYVEKQWMEGGGERHPLILSGDVIKKTEGAYHTLFERWTGETLSTFQKNHM